MLKRKISAFLAGVLAVSSIGTAIVSAAPAEPRPATYEEAFMSMYEDIKDPSHGYFDDEGLPNHSIETLMVEAPDYGHVTTSEAVSYYVWLEAMYGKFSGDWSTLPKSWTAIEGLIPDASEQPGNSGYNPNSPATYADEYETPDKYPSKIDSSVPVGADPISAELKSAYGTADIYGMHWLMDLDNWYGYGTGTKATFINTFQRGEQESTWETVPHPSVEKFQWGGTNGFLDLFVKDSSYSKQWRYTNAPDADGRAVQAMYWANKWAKEQGKSVKTTLDKAVKLGDYLRYSFFDKYFKKIGGGKQGKGSGYDGAHYLYSWYYAWGGDVNGMWSWRIGSSHNHFGYQNPFAAWALGNDPDMKPKSSNGQKDNKTSMERQLEFYTWLQSSEGAIAGGATNSWLGRYETLPSNVSTFYTMGYVENPVYADPGSNTWFGFQAWSMQRIAELYLETGNTMAKDLMDKWIKWVKTVVKFENGTYSIPSGIDWDGQPDTWSGSRSDNSNLHVSITSEGQDLGVTGSLANTLIVYAAATKKHATLDQECVDMADTMLKVIWENYRDDKGVMAPEARGDYNRFFETEIYIPSGWSGKMANGDVIKPGVKFIDIRSKYKQDPEWQKVYDAYQYGEKPVMEYHRFWAQSDIALALGMMAIYFPDQPFDGKINIPGGGGSDGIKGDANDDEVIDSTDLALVKRKILGIKVTLNEDNADVNDDGAIDSTDLALIKRHILGIKKIV